MVANASKAQRLHKVAIGLGSNRWHARHGPPPRTLEAAVAALAAGGVVPLARSPIRGTAPIGPRQRRFANAVLVGLWPGAPLELLALLKATERGFGRRRARRWGPRVLDCDLLVFDRAVINCPGLRVPHPGLARRAFVLQPLLGLWPDWRHPELGLSVRQMAARLSRQRPVD